MDINLLRKKTKRAEFKREIPKAFKGIIFGFLVVWSFFTFFNLSGDIEWKELIDQCRRLMFVINIKLSGTFKI